MQKYSCVHLYVSTHWFVPQAFLKKKTKHNAVLISVLGHIWKFIFHYAWKRFKRFYLCFWWINNPFFFWDLKERSWSTCRPVDKQSSFSPCLCFTLEPLHLLTTKSRLIFTSAHTFIHTPTLTPVPETTDTNLYRSDIILKRKSHSARNKIGSQRIEKLRFVTTCGTWT